ncbi:DNA ligase-associated DEXH box helicase [Rubrivivax gelatinosus]|uniref:ligase-associated DNA damage response DEXH box helicase n=1 Tax=Rubrivivax gelatinosus TaxID=28068 RepID=UPI0019033115|nr:ligase-associated DNA damage response DEXH box helicase [Rubrivivax gelatinosus]MBK1614803.1 DNA ligase-associated DEXH box helicase [Rubrivivax gelatinosus]
MNDATGPDAAEAWFAARGWQPFEFQRRVWRALAGGDSGLLHATTGSGKTYAVWFGAAARALARATPRRGLQVLWLTPMRALAADTTRALQAAAPTGWTVGQRTGDTPSAERARQDRRLPEALVTTPESLSLLLTRASAQADLSGVHSVVVDEWHELIGSKRGVQLQLALARLRRWNPGLAVWGLSATIGNLAEAMATLVGHEAGTLVQGKLDKRLVIDTLLPQEPGRFSWGGHLGAQMLQPVVDEIESASTTLVFTNVRSQAEIWYRLILDARPDWAGLVALHHGSLDRSVREWVEAGLKQGSLKAVVATSSLDLGVDFLPVERVLQIGSAKGIARLLQRAGRSGHAPGRASRVTLVPTNTLELVEAAAARRAALAGQVEARRTPDKPLDVLVQHLVTVALGGGFEADALFDEVRSAPAYRTLTRSEFDWALAFVERGGDSLGAYPEYHRVQQVDGVWRVVDRGIAQRHRLQVGTIVADATMQVKWLSGGTIGSVEEGFIARLKPGDVFVFAGRLLEYVRTQDLAAYVRKATKPKGLVPAWNGSRMPLSSELAGAVQALLEQVAGGVFGEPELEAARPMLAAQQRLSQLPRRGRLLVERLRSREGHHLFLYPFAGRNVHVGLAQLLAWRLARQQPNTYSLSVNDYGLEILAAQPPDWAPLADASLFATDSLLADVLASLNSGELAQRRFREIARVAGLVFGGYPGAPKSLRQLQASSSLFWGVFRRYDAGNRLLQQAEAEVLAQELEIGRLAATLEAMKQMPIEIVELKVASPFALPLLVERLRERLSTEQMKDRLARLLAASEAALDAPRRARR